MRAIIRNTLFLITFISNTSFAQKGPSFFGTFVGFLHVQEINVYQLIKIDFLFQKKTPQKIELAAFLTLFFGSFDSSEYITYHFDNVSYDVLTSQLVFEKTDQDISMVIHQFDGKTLKGRLRSSQSGEVGLVELTREEEFKNDFELKINSKTMFEPLAGEYISKNCRGTQKALHIETVRTLQDTTRLGNLYRNFQITAQQGSLHSEWCPTDVSFCTDINFSEGVYDFLKGKLTLIGRAKVLTCNRKGSNLTCEDCVYVENNKPKTKEKEFLEIKNANWKTPTFEPSIDETSIEGTYRGYIHHERRNVYQSASLNIATFQRAKDTSQTSELILSTVGAVYFGDFNQNESISYRFKEKPIVLNQPLILENFSDDVDAVLTIKTINKHEIKGIWFSHHYGRIGEFYLTKNKPPILDGEKILLPTIEGQYTSPDWTLDLFVVRTNAPITSTNPYFPLNFRGYIHLHNEIDKDTISGGSYDFYTGSINIQFFDGSMLLGWRPRDRKTLKLWRPTPGAWRPLLPFEYKSFEPII